jgi:hypothetical protein
MYTSSASYNKHCQMLLGCKAVVDTTDNSSDAYASKMLASQLQTQSHTNILRATVAAVQQSQTVAVPFDKLIASGHHQHYEMMNINIPTTISTAPSLTTIATSTTISTVLSSSTIVVDSSTVMTHPSLVVSAELFAVRLVSVPVHKLLPSYRLHTLSNVLYIHWKRCLQV